jgi:hypothetical protein
VSNAQLDDSLDPEEVRRFELTIIQAIDLYSLLDAESQRLLLELRARDQFLTHLADVVRPGQHLGSYICADSQYEQASQRQLRSVAQFDKSIFTLAFLERWVPVLLHEPEGQQLCDPVQDIRLGRRITARLHTGLSEKSITYVSSELRIFREGLISFRFRFYGDGVGVENMTDVISELRTHARTAASEKLVGILRDLAALCPNPDRLLLRSATQDARSIADTVARFARHHTVLLIEGLQTTDGRPVQTPDLLRGPALIGLLRQTRQAVRYKQELVDGLRKMNVGYKQDEIYITFRGTTVIVLPDHWEPESYLSVYPRELQLIIEYLTAKISYLDVLTYGFEEIEAYSPPELHGETRDLVARVLLLRRVLSLLQESLDVDMLINHYFTRAVVVQFLEQRGATNKLNAVKSRISNLSESLSLIAEFDVTGQSLASSLRQVRVAIWALGVTLMLSLATLVVSILALRNP